MKVIYACQICKHESAFDIEEGERIIHTCKKCGNVLKFRYTPHMKCKWCNNKMVP